MLNLADLDTLDLLFATNPEKKAIEKFILFKTGCKTLQEAREFVVVNRDIAWLFNRIDPQKKQ